MFLGEVDLGNMQMKKILISCVAVILFAILPVYVSAQTVSDYEITLRLSFGSRHGTFTGTLVDGLPHGEGVFEYLSPGRVWWRFEGEFVNGHFQGEGDFTSEQSHRQVGTFYNSRLHGEGRLYDAGGQLRAYGIFEDGYLLSGVASDYDIALPLSFGNRRGQFTGNLENGLPQGNGIFEYVSPGGMRWRYEGEFVNGQFQGEGDFTAANNDRQVGTFYNSRLHGEGRLYTGGRLSASGIFVEGELWDGTQYRNINEADHVSSTTAGVGVADSTVVAMSVVIMVGMFVFFFVLPVVVIVVAVFKMVARNKAQAQLDILSKQVEMKRHEVVIWECRSCGASNHNRTICEYCGSGMPI